MRTMIAGFRRTNVRFERPMDFDRISVTFYTTRKRYQYERSSMPTPEFSKKIANLQSQFQ